MSRIGSGWQFGFFFTCHSPTHTHTHPHTVCRSGPHRAEVTIPLGITKRCGRVCALLDRPWPPKIGTKEFDKNGWVSFLGTPTKNDGSPFGFPLESPTKGLNKGESPNREEANERHVMSGRLGLVQPDLHVPATHFVVAHVEHPAVLALSSSMACAGLTAVASQQ